MDSAPRDEVVSHIEVVFVNGDLEGDLIESEPAVTILLGQIFIAPLLPQQSLELNVRLKLMSPGADYLEDVLVEVLDGEVSIEDSFLEVIFQGEGDELNLFLGGDDLVADLGLRHHLLEVLQLLIRLILLHPLLYFFLHVHLDFLDGFG
eukprot:CAMPEP_0170552874 /NCGR_PEP_ID=MMETSP0211-20121228/10770_1 /TAXON_ID=311385 /ORGANISM="Pseudokeronopsis sp., Strain OXSARD2" /LENGTH=148 /DNA_ID=CAMNT_0010860911 /DNA_START=63 /DNA_END=505 /DNA_ORIENTATION=-